MKSFALILALALTACGRSNTVYPDASGDTAISLGTDGVTQLPNGFYDQSVNNAVVDIDPSHVLRFRTLGGSPGAGQFVDSTATGDSAMVSTGLYDGKTLSSFSLSVASSAPLNVSLLVDLACDGTSAVATITAPVSSSLAVSDASWLSDGSDISASGSVVLSSSVPSSLSALLAAYPSACLRSDRSLAPDMPASIPVGSVLLSLGSSSSADTATVLVSDLKIYGDDYSTWGTR